MPDALQIWFVTHGRFESLQTVNRRSRQANRLSPLVNTLAATMMSPPMEITCRPADVSGRSAVSRAEHFWLTGLIGGSVVLFLCGLTVADPDLWGHTLYGLRSIESGVLTETTDPFSYTAPGAHWVNHEWLSELIYGGLWLAGGEVVLVLWRNLIIAGIALVIHASLRRSQAGLAATLLLLTLNAECLSEFVVFVRPQLATFLIFSVWLFVLRSYWDQPSRWVWTLPVSLVLWVNLHGGFLAGLGILAVFGIGTVIRAGLSASREEVPALRRALADYSVRELAAVSGCCAIATLINPYGFDLHRMLWTHLLTEQAVREWQPIWDISTMIDGHAPLWSLGRSLLSLVPFLIAVPTLLFSRRWQWIDLAILLVVGWQAACHLRHIALLSLATLLLLSGPLTEALRNVFASLTDRWSRPDARQLRICGVAATCLFLLGLQIHGTAQMWRRGIAPWEIAVECRSYVPGVPANAVGFIHEHKIEGNLVTDYGWGQYVLWHCYPQNRVAFDGRYRTVFPANIEREFFALQRAGVEQPETTPILDRHPTDIALVPAGRSVDVYLKGRSDFRCVYRDTQAAVFVQSVSKFEHLPAASDISQIALKTERWLSFPARPVITGTSVAGTRGKSSAIAVAQPALKAVSGN